MLQFSLLFYLLAFCICLLNVFICILRSNFQLILANLSNYIECGGMQNCNVWLSRKQPQPESVIHKKQTRYNSVNILILNTLILFYIFLCSPWIISKIVFRYIKWSNYRSNALKIKKPTNGSSSDREQKSKSMHHAYDGVEHVYLHIWCRFLADSLR